jgi:SAM-dependent methyltransferase
VKLLGFTLRPKAFWRDVRLAFHSLFGAKDADRLIFLSLTNYPDLARPLEVFATEMPQAGVVEDALTAFESRPWRIELVSAFRGLGLEIGPLHRALPMPPSARVHYVDRHTPTDLLRLHPELSPYDLQRPHFLADGETLDAVADGRYDFVIASHVLEHMRNPVQALVNWCRVIKRGGSLYLIVPDKRKSFDRRRVRTTLEHLILDYRAPSAERDLEHYVDYAVHVDGLEGEAAVDAARSMQARAESIHFHVFLPGDLLRLVRWLGAHVRPLAVTAGPVSAPDSEEFHLVLRVE